VWQYEPDRFEFKEVGTKGRFYTPDFRILFPDGHFEYHEIKGWDYPSGKLARRRFRQYYPEYKLVVIDKNWFDDARLRGVDKFIPYWENSTGHINIKLEEDRDGYNL